MYGVCMWYVNMDECICIHVFGAFVAFCSRLLLFVAICCYLLLFFAICCYLLLFAVICCCLLLFVAICNYLLLFVVIYRPHLLLFVAICWYLLQFLFKLGSHRWQFKKGAEVEKDLKKAVEKATGKTLVVKGACKGSAQKGFS
jgi:hypothetical protein